VPRATKNAETTAKPTAKRTTRTGNGKPGSDSVETARVARTYIEAVGRRDRNAQMEWYAPDATARIFGVMGPASRDEMKAYFEALFDACPDFKLEIVDVIAEGDRAAVHWHGTGTFSGDHPYMGIEAHGATIDLEGIDRIQVVDGKIVRIDAFTDNMTVARQIGMLPPQDSKGEQRLTAAFNAKTRLTRRLGAAEVESVADGVWLIRGGFPARLYNVYLIEDEGGVTVYDAGIKTMSKSVLAAAGRLGGVKRIVLGHGHTDHRGTAPAIGAPVYCHPDEVEDAEGSGGFRYWGDLSGLPTPVRQIHKFSHNHMWDGGPVKIEGTVSEGDEVAGFEVVHLPGHAPGLIGLWRESDRLALCTDAFYMIDMWGRPGAARVPHEAYNIDTEQARESIRKLAALEPSSAWPGHVGPLTGDVRGQLEQAAATT
jgi:glyoxylase-like metal-dependent hydrolase (beta-lactamase superfamily II)/predicted ester cyclase